jgi:hypothetical protein
MFYAAAAAAAACLLLVKLNTVTAYEHLTN